MNTRSLFTALRTNRAWPLLLLALPVSVCALPSPLIYVYGRADFPAGNGGLLATSGDFNGDGRPDFAVISYEDNSVSILLGQPDGSFSDSGVSYAVGVQPVAAAVGDFDGDGHVDLAVLNQACPASDPCPPGSVSILLGRGDGTFQPRVDYATGPNPVAVIVDDSTVTASQISRSRTRFRVLARAAREWFPSS